MAFWLRANIEQIRVLQGQYWQLEHILEGIIHKAAHLRLVNYGCQTQYFFAWTFVEQQTYYKFLKLDSVKSMYYWQYKQKHFVQNKQNYFKQ